MEYLDVGSDAKRYVPVLVLQWRRCGSPAAVRSSALTIFGDVLVVFAVLTLPSIGPVTIT